MPFLLSPQLHEKPEPGRPGRPCPGSRAKLDAVFRQKNALAYSNKACRATLYRADEGVRPYALVHGVFSQLAPLPELCSHAGCTLMPPITALLHTQNDSRHLGRALEMLRPCDEILVIDHASSDGTRLLARQYGAVVRSAAPSAPPTTYLALARHDWILCLLPYESLTEALEASLFEWKLRPREEVADIVACLLPVREETASGWTDTAPAIRLVPRTWACWEGTLPASHKPATLLEGHLLRFYVPGR